MNQSRVEKKVEDYEKRTDFLDFATHVAENLVVDGVAHVQREAEKTYQRLGPPTGFCLYCEEETRDPTARFCDLECSQGWQRVQDAEKRNRQ